MQNPASWLRKVVHVESRQGHEARLCSPDEAKRNPGEVALGGAPKEVALGGASKEVTLGGNQA